MLEKVRKPLRVLRPPLPARRASWPTELVWRYVQRLLVVYPQDMLLDVACGDGELLRRIGEENDQAHLAGICATPQYARTARNRLPEADIMYAELDDFPWLNDSFDVAVCAQSIAAMKDPATTFAEARRVLKPGGQFILSAPWLPPPLRGPVNRFLLEESTDSAPLYAPRQIKYFLQRAGFEQITWTRVSLFAGVTVAWKKKSSNVKMNG